MTIVAIDFETANSARSSPCAIGLAFIEGGAVVRRGYSLIRPHAMRFDAINIRVHGIRPHDVMDAPEFPEVFETIRAELDGALVLAHNASFDVAVLRQTLALYGLAQPSFSSFCTVSLARRLWPEEPSRKLSALAHRFGIGFQHHHAGEDAFACAAIALEGVRQAGARDILDLAALTGLSRPVAATHASIKGGIADWALAARGARTGRADASWRFVVRGSTGTPYDVVLARTGQGVWRLSCSCVGARFRSNCRHTKDLMRGEFRNLVPANPDDFRRLTAFIAGRQTMFAAE